MSKTENPHPFMSKEWFDYENSILDNRQKVVIEVNQALKNSIGKTITKIIIHGQSLFPNNDVKFTLGNMIQDGYFTIMCENKILLILALKEFNGKFKNCYSEVFYDDNDDVNRIVFDYYQIVFN